MARMHEINQNNNNIFNGRNVSDNTKVTSFYALKAQPTLQSPLLYFGQATAAGGQQATTTTVPESSAVRELFTNDVRHMTAE